MRPSTTTERHKNIVATFFWTCGKSIPVDFFDHLYSNCALVLFFRFTPASLKKGYQTFVLAFYIGAALLFQYYIYASPGSSGKETKRLKTIKINNDKIQEIQARAIEASSHRAYRREAKRGKHQSRCLFCCGGTAEPALRHAKNSELRFFKLCLSTVVSTYPTQIHWCLMCILHSC